MDRCQIAIIYEPKNGQALKIAAVGDRRLLLETAQIAIAEAEQCADSLRGGDPHLAFVQRAEADRLRTVLANLVPELRVSPALM